MLVSIALTAATVCTARACTKRLDKTQWPETRDETCWAKTETYCSETETRPETHRSEIETRPRREVSTSRDRDVSTETTSLATSWQNLPSGYPTIVPSLRICLARLSTRKAAAEIGQLLRWRRVCADGERLGRIRRHRTRTTLAGISDHYSLVVNTV